MNISLARIIMAPLFCALLGLAVMGSASPAPSGMQKGGDVKKEVVIEGRISKLMSQHMVGHVQDKSPDYFDVDGGSQIVVHSSKEIKCPDRARLKGTIFSVTGQTGSKGEGWSEPQMDVISWECIPSK